MRTSFHHQPEAQHPNFQLPTSWQANYPIFWSGADKTRLSLCERRNQRRHSGNAQSNLDRQLS